DWKAAAISTVVPHLGFTSDYLMIFVALLGTTISPYLFFWQANQEVEEADIHDLGLYRECGSSLASKIKCMRLDVSAGMIFSNLISWFIILAAAAVIFAHGGSVEIASADEAARVLRPLAGPFASALFMLGIIGTGLLAVPIFSSTAAYALSELFGFSEGLSKKWHEAKLFYFIIIISTAIGALMNLLGISPVRALIYAAVINAVIAAPLIFIIMRLAGDHALMGEYRTRAKAKIFGWLAFAVMTLASAAWIISLLLKK
ncbi:MAG TPA: divalent metal cation transporter, partial [Patescibacteria group bacterium]|nr:divalent metal cation transporter [Patescibacteria group bacterium]